MNISLWCDTPGLDVQVVNQEFKVFLKSVLSPTDTPPIFDMGWGADYPDANNFTREVTRPNITRTYEKTSHNTLKPGVSSSNNLKGCFSRF